MRGYTFPDYYHFTYFARAMRLTTCLRVLHLENSNIQGKFMISLCKFFLFAFSNRLIELFFFKVNAIKDNEFIKELYLSENKLQSTDGMYIGGFLKENRYLEVFDVRSNQLSVSFRGRGEGV
jgi:hypothetical protein